MSLTLWHLEVAQYKFLLKHDIKNLFMVTDHIFELLYPIRQTRKNDVILRFLMAVL